MSNIRISELAELIDVKSTDIVPVVSNGTTKKITLANLSKVMPTGPKGDTGATGLQGPKGDKGDIGLTGAQGIQGPQGPQGIKGDTGIQGLKGDKGDKGDPGIQGVQGPKGDTIQLVNDYSGGIDKALTAEKGKELKDNINTLSQGMQLEVSTINFEKLNKADLLNEIKEVDGINSGLDADLFQGLPAESYFKKSNVIKKILSSEFVPATNVEIDKGKANYMLIDTFSKIVSLQLSVRCISTNDSFSNNTLLGTISPSDITLRQQDDVYVPCLLMRDDFSQNSIGYIRLSTDGSIHVFTGLNGGAAPFGAVTFQCSYFVPLYE